MLWGVFEKEIRVKKNAISRLRVVKMGHVTTKTQRFSKNFREIARFQKRIVAFSEKKWSRDQKTATIQKKIREIARFQIYFSGSKNHVVCGFIMFLKEILVRKIRNTQNNFPPNLKDKCIQTTL